MFRVKKYVYGAWHYLCETGRTRDPLEWGWLESAKRFDGATAETLARLYDASLEPC